MRLATSSSRSIALVEQVRHQIRQIPGIRLLEAEAVTELGFPALDPTRITIDLSNLGISGFEADEILHQQFGVTAELPGLTPLNTHTVRRISLNHLNISHTKPIAVRPNCDRFGVGNVEVIEGNAPDCVCCRR
ncbi:hypothetical protein [Leptolyngbya ohadii]|uniref:hypothetical protein n=1 Tax=Leptolyngbya ohadii TaxID=1962290 RepID=UPI0015C5C70A|nr:hypothetical protein [Leptolyngbya ohadii]